MAVPRWHWRNTRYIAIGVTFTPVSWRWGVDLSGDDPDEVYGIVWRLNLGPIHFRLEASIGSNDDWLWLSESEAWDRSCRWEGIDPDIDPFDGPDEFGRYF